MKYSKIKINYFYTMEGSIMTKFFGHFLTCRHLRGCNEVSNPPPFKKKNLEIGHRKNHRPKSLFQQQIRIVDHNPSINPVPHQPYIKVCILTVGRCGMARG